MRIIVMAIVVACLALGHVRLSADPENAVIESYNGSPNLPDWATYQIFLVLAQGNAENPERGDHFMVEALGIDNDTVEGAAKVDFFNSWFVASLSEIERETASETLRILCSGNWASMGFEDIVSRMDERESMRERLYAEHYTITLDKLSAEERPAFLALFVKLKKSSSFVKIDLAKYYEEDAEKAARASQAGMCSDALIAQQ